MEVPKTNLGFDLLIHILPSPFHLSLYHWIRQRTKKFVPYVKCLLIVILGTPIALWTVGGVTVSGIMSIVVAFGLPFMETFRAIGKEGIPIHRMVIKCFTEGLRRNLKGASTIVCDFKDFSVHSFSSIIQDLLKSREQEPFGFKFTCIPGCIFTAFLGVLVDVPVITMITVYKAPIMLFKGSNRLIQDLIWREGPFLETVCVPFAVIWILSWPIAVLLAIGFGIMSSFCFGCYAAVVAYQESSMWRGLLYVVAAASIFDEYSNELLYLHEGSLFPRPRYRQHVGSSSSLPPLSSQLEQSDIICHEQVGSTSSLLPVNSQVKQREVVCAEEPLVGPPSVTMKPLQAAVTWDSFIETCKDIGKELLQDGAIGVEDLDAWKESRNKIINIGIPACAFLACFLYSIKNGSPGFLLRGGVEITSVNRPKGRIFDWLYEPMCIVKEQIRSLNLSESEELFFYKYCLYSGDKSRIKLWQNGGMPPQDEIRRAQLEGIGRRLQGLCSTLSRMPTSRRHFHELVKAIEQEAKNLRSFHHGGNGSGGGGVVVE